MMFLTERAAVTGDGASRLEIQDKLPGANQVFNFCEDSVFPYY
jgi:hypothetical protein